MTYPSKNTRLLILLLGIVLSLVAAGFFSYYKYYHLLWMCGYVAGYAGCMFDIIKKEE